MSRREARRRQERARAASPPKSGTGQARPHSPLPVWPGVAAAALVAVVYLAAASAGTFRFRPSRFPHHVLVADAWLHGQLHVRDQVLQDLNERYYQQERASVERGYQASGRPFTEEIWQDIRARLKPPSMHDWSYFEGKYYGYWPPMASALLVPYVAVAGLRASDTLLSCLVGAATVLLTFLMLREADRLGLVPVTTAAATALALLLGLGTVHFYLAVTGHVWFFSQIVAAFFLTMAMWFILRADRSWPWAAAAGAAFGASFLSRNSVLLTAPFFIGAAYAIGRRRTPHPWPETIRLTAIFFAPLVLAGALQLAYNTARFGGILEDGVRTQIATGGHPRFQRDYAEHGSLSLYYVPRNVYYYFLNPTLRQHRRTQAMTFDPFGNSMFLVTPAFLYVFSAFRRRDGLLIGTWAGVGATLVLLLSFMGTGWYNFGNRYLLDLIPLVILLVAVGMGGRLMRRSALLIGLSIVVNAWGTYRFCIEAA